MIFDRLSFPGTRWYVGTGPKNGTWSEKV